MAARISSPCLARSARRRRRPEAPPAAQARRLSRVLSLIVQAVTDQAAAEGQPIYRREQARLRIHGAMRAAALTLEALAKARVS